MKPIRGVECKGIVKQIRAAKSLKMSFLVALFLFAVSVCLVVGVSKQEVEASNTTIYLSEEDDETSQEKGYAVLNGECIVLEFDVGSFRAWEYVWYKDGNEIDSLDYGYIVEDNKLIIDGAVKSNYGTYYVRAMGNGGNYINSEKVILKVSEKNFGGNLTIVDKRASYWKNIGCCVDIAAWGGSGEYELKIELCDAATGKIESRHISYGSEHHVLRKSLTSEQNGWKNINVTITDTFGNTVSMTEKVLFVDPVNVELLANGNNKEIHIKEGSSVNFDVNITGGTGDYKAEILSDSIFGTEIYAYDFLNDFSIQFHSPQIFTLYMKVTDSNGMVAFSQSITVNVHYFRVWITNKESLPDTMAVGDTIEIQYKIECDYVSGTYINSMVYANAARVEEDRILYEEVGVVKWTANMEIESGMDFCVRDTKTGFHNDDFIRIRVWKDGIYQEEDGKWYYYTKGELNSGFTGMVQNGNEIWYIKNGVFVNSYTGMYVYNGKWIYVRNGKYDSTYTGMARNSAGVWYMKNGNLDRTYTGMYLHNGKWIYVKDGKYDTTYTGMAMNKYGWWYIKNGKLDRTYTGFAKNSYGTWYMQKGKLDRTFSGKVVINGKTYVIKNGKLV